MPNNNPEGVNGFQGFGTEQPYGQKTRDAQLQSMAPTPPVPALGAPKRAQKKAVKRGSRAPAPEPVIAPPHADPTQPVSQQQMVAQVWAQLAETPGASPLVQQIAQEAQGVV